MLCGFTGSAVDQASEEFWHRPGDGVEPPDDDRKNLAVRNVEHGVLGPGRGLSASRCCSGQPAGGDDGPWCAAPAGRSLVYRRGLTGRRRGAVRFADRADAGRQLAARLQHLRGQRIVVLGLPRGGVPVAFEVARALGAPLDVIVVRKLGVPFQPELGMGAIGEDGVRVLSDAGSRDTSIPRGRHRARRPAFPRGRAADGEVLPSLDGPDRMPCRWPLSAAGLRPIRLIRSDACAAGWLTRAHLSCSPRCSTPPSTR